MSADYKLSVYLSGGCPGGILCVGGSDLERLIAWIKRIEDKLESVSKERDALISELKKERNKVNANVTRHQEDS